MFKRLASLLTLLILPTILLTFPVAVVVLVIADVARFWQSIPGKEIAAVIFGVVAVLLAGHTIVMYRHPERSHDPMIFSIAFDRGWHAASLYAAIAVALLTTIPAAAVYLPARLIGTILKAVIVPVEDTAASG